MNWKPDISAIMLSSLISFNFGLEDASFFDCGHYILLWQGKIKDAPKSVSNTHFC